MRLVKHYIFNINTKIPFSEWPEIVHRFLLENHLTSHRFLYFFDDYLRLNETADVAPAYSGCARILKDCPSLGEIRYHNGSSHGMSDRLWLSNIDRLNEFPESNILPLMKKIHRRYGFSSSHLYYFDIDFFGKRTCFERDYSVALRMSRSREIPFDPTLYMEHQPYGSGITLQRSGESYLKLSVDLLHDGIVMDATPYYESMQKLLPQIKATSSLSIYLTEEEQQCIEEVNTSADPVLKMCRVFFAERLPFTSSQNAFPSNYSISKPLKKLAKKYGYIYRLVWSGGAYSLEKRTEKGNVIYIELDCGPSHYSLGAEVSYQGVGFRHSLGVCNQTPTNQQEADAYMEDILSVVSEFEKTLLPELDSMFPETPSWFIPYEFP